MFFGVLLQTEGDVGLHRILRAAEQAPNRLLIKFSFDIPERDVDGAHRRAPHAGLPARIELFVELVPDAFGFERIFAAQKGRELAIDKFLHAEALRAARETVAGDALVGFDAANKIDVTIFSLSSGTSTGTRCSVALTSVIFRIHLPCWRCQLAWIAAASQIPFAGVAIACSRRKDSYSTLAGRNLCQRQSVLDAELSSL